MSPLKQAPPNIRQNPRSYCHLLSANILMSELHKRQRLDWLKTHWSQRKISHRLQLAKTLCLARLSQDKHQHCSQGQAVGWLPQHAAPTCRALWHPQHSPSSAKTANTKKQLTMLKVILTFMLHLSQQSAMPLEEWYHLWTLFYEFELCLSYLDPCIWHGRCQMKFKHLLWMLYSFSHQRIFEKQQCSICSSTRQKEKQYAWWTGQLSTIPYSINKFLLTEH